MALLSAATLRETNPRLPFCIITNVTNKIPRVDFWDEDRDHYIYLEKDTRDNRQIKVSLNEYTPFRKTIFLDCDTFVVGDLSIASIILDYYDMAFRLNQLPQRRQGKGDIKIFDEILVSELPHWNSGVILFKKNENTTDFFNFWRNSFNSIAIEYDQVALVEAIFNSKTRVLSLDQRWNDMSFYSFKNYKRKNNEIIFHYTSRISDILYKEIMKYANSIPDNLGNNDVKDFILLKRKQRLKKIRWKQYLKLRIKWKLFP